MNRAAILRVLESCASRCLDVEDERNAVADALQAAVYRDIDAALIRHVFQHAPTGGTRLIVMREIGGKREADVLDAAARLAGCPT